MATITMPYDGGNRSFEVPDRQLGEVVAPNRLPATADPEALIEQALAHPIGSSKLEELVTPGQKVAVIIDDISRPTPTARMLPPVLRRLAGAGVGKADVRIVIALGSHRPLTSDEIIIKTGVEVAAEYEIINIPCQDQSAMRQQGKSSNGIIVELNRFVTDADFRIGLGAITPHMDAGFSGGGKILLPGICSCRTIDSFHAKSAEVPGNHLGNPEAPTRMLLEEFVSETVPLDFILNAVTHPMGGLYQCVAGHFVAAHRQGVKHARELYGVEVERRYPLVIVNAWPFEIDFWQSSKAFWCGELLAEDGGLVVMVSPCPEGVATHPLWAEYLGWDAEELLSLLERNEAEDPSACGFAVMFNRLRERVRFGVVAPTLTAEMAGNMGLAHFDSLEQALAISLDHGRDKVAAVVTQGGTIFPWLH